MEDKNKTKQIRYLTKRCTLHPLGFRGQYFGVMLFSFDFYLFFSGIFCVFRVVDDDWMDICPQPQVHTLVDGGDSTNKGNKDCKMFIDTATILTRALSSIDLFGFGRDTPFACHLHLPSCPLAPSCPTSVPLNQPLRLRPQRNNPSSLDDNNSRTYCSHRA